MINIGNVFSFSSSKFGNINLLSEYMVNSHKNSTKLYSFYKISAINDSKKIILLMYNYESVTIFLPRKAAISW